VTSPTPITSARPHSWRPRTRRQGLARCPGDPWEQEYGRDVWRLGKLGIDDRRLAHISFENIPQPWLKDLAKRWARWRLSTGLGAAAAASGTRAVARFAAFLADPVVNVDHLGQVDRAVLERYLARLHAELAGRVVHRSMIGQLNLFFTAIRPSPRTAPRRRQPPRPRAGFLAIEAESRMRNSGVVSSRSRSQP
jgi:hypothetical protein